MNDFSKLIVCSVVALNCLFVLAVFAVFWHTGAEPAALVVGWFGWTTGELWALSKIKRDKLQQKGENMEGMSEDD